MKVCDEINENQIILILRAGETEKMLWKNVHDLQNRNWDRKYIKGTKVY